MDDSIKRKCPHCENELALSIESETNKPTVYALLPMEYSNGNYVLHIGQNTEKLPIFAYVCTKCGHIEFASAVILGIVDNTAKNV